MGIIKISVLGKYISFVKEDLKVLVENNSFIDSFKVPHSNYPIRVIENETTKKALGDFQISTANKRKYIPCVIEINQSIYNGKIEQISRTRQFRKCDVSFVSPVDSILDTKLAKWIPTINLLGDDPEEVPYTEESDEEHEAFTAWQAKYEEIRNKRFPDTYWQMPHIPFPDLFVEDPEDADENTLDYWGIINAKNIYNELAVNTSDTDVDRLTIFNVNAYVPHVFIKAPLFEALDSIGYKLKGAFAESDLFNSALFDAYEHNMTKIEKTVTGVPVDFNGLSWIDRDYDELGYDFPPLPILPPTRAKRRTYTTTSAGDFKVLFDFQFPTFDGNLNTFSGFCVFWQGDRIGEISVTEGEEAKGEFSFSIAPAEVGDDLVLIYHHQSEVMPVDYSMEVMKNIPNKTFLDAHPTIDFSRNLPDWSIAETLNNLKNLFNLKIDIDDITKTVTIVYNKEYLLNGDSVKLTRDFYTEQFDNIETENFLLKFANDDDEHALISKNAISEDNKLPEDKITIENKFKQDPFKDGFAKITRAYKDKDGHGVYFYVPNNDEFLSETVDGIKITFEGENNLHEKLWKKWIKFRLNGALLKAELPMTKTQLDFIDNLRKIETSDQSYLVKSYNYKETPSGLILVEFELQSISF